MVGGDLVRTKRDQQQRTGFRTPNHERTQHVDRGLVRPVPVLDEHHGRRPIGHRTVDHAGGQTAAACVTDTDIGDFWERLLNRRQRSRGRRTIARAAPEPHPAGVAPQPGVDDGRLAHTGLARNQHDPADPAVNGIEQTVHRSQQINSLDQRHRHSEVAALRRRGRCAVIDNLLIVTPPSTLVTAPAVSMAMCRYGTPPVGTPAGSARRPNMPCVQP